MTREEAAEKALNGYDIDGRCLDPSQVFIDGFCEGAEWADGNRWISVKDQLPQMHVLVLCRYVWGENKGFMLTRRTNFTPNALDPNGFDTQEREPPFTYLKVTHWMEIPLINCN